MLEHSIYSVISPEGCASILWRTSDAVQEAASSLKLTSNECLKLGIVDEIIPEKPGGAHRFKIEQYSKVKYTLLKKIKNLRNLSNNSLLQKRNEKEEPKGEPEN